MRLSPDLARNAIKEKISSKMNLSTEEAAWAIHERVNEDVAAAFRLYASEVGVDYRRYSFVPFGGAGPVHSMRIAKKLGISKVVIPPRAGVLSAEGLLVSPISVDLALTKRVELSDLSFEDHAKVFTELIQRGESLLLSSTGATTSKVAVTRYLDMCYHGQGYDIPILLRGEHSSKKEFQELGPLFEKGYHEKYSVSGFSKFIDITAYKVTVSSSALKIPNKLVDKSRVGRKRTTRKAFDPDARRFANFEVLSRYLLNKDEKIRGPALIQEVESTLVLPSKSVALVDGFGNLVVEMHG